MSGGYDDEYEGIDEDDIVQKPYYTTWQFILVSVLITPVLIYLFVVKPVLAIPPKITVPVLSKYDTVEFELSPLSMHETKKKHHHTKKERIILIGDVHGCYNQLVELLQASKYNAKHDQVILLGDFLSKGPDSMKVLNYAMENQFLTVLGNHELSILYKYSNYKPLRFDDDDTFRDGDRLQSMIKLSLPKITGLDSELLLAHKLTPAHVKFLASSPLVLDLGLVPYFNSNPSSSLVETSAPKIEEHKLLHGVATHIGVHEPYGKIDEQKVKKWLNIDKNWFKDFNREMKSPTLSDGNRTIVFYGHHSGVGLNLQRYTKGLDSGCVKGNELSGLIIASKLNNNGKITYSQELIQVDCP